MRKQLLNVVGFSALIIAFLIAGAPIGNAIPSDKDVRVVNTTAEPVPTAAQGTTTIAGTVNLAAGSTVNVANTPATALSVLNLNDARQPFQVSFGFAQPALTNVSNVTIATVPAGKRLVIEFVTMSAQVPPGEHAEIMEINTITAPFGGASHQLLIEAQPDAVIGDAIFRAVQQLKLYADGGSQVKVLFRRNSAAGGATFGGTISGYLVDM